MWHSYSNLPVAVAVVILWSGKIPVSLVNVDSIREQDVISGFQSCLGFSSRKGFAWKALPRCGNHCFDYPSWSMSIPERASSSVACCLCPALVLSCHMTLLMTFIWLFSFLLERKWKLKISGQDELSVCVRYYCLTISKGLLVLWCVLGWLSLHPSKHSGSPAWYLRPPPGVQALQSCRRSLEYFGFVCLVLFPFLSI